LDAKRPRSGLGRRERSCAFSIDGAEGDAGNGHRIAPTAPEKLANSNTPCAATRASLRDVVFVKRGQIPKTTSEKSNAGDLRRRFIDGSLSD